MMLRPPRCSCPRCVPSALSGLAASLEALICSDRFQLTLGVLKQMGMLLLTRERAPVFLLSHLPSSPSWVGTQEARWACCSGQSCVPLEWECPQDSTVGFADQIKNVSLYI